MTSMTMGSQWTAPTMLSLWTEPTTKRSKVVRHLSIWAKVIDTTATVLCPVAVSASAIFAAAAWPAEADPVAKVIQMQSPAPVTSIADTPVVLPGR